MDLVEFNRDHHGFHLSGTAAYRDDALVFKFRLAGPLESLVWPAPTRMPEQRDGLWEHTCFEAFLSRPGATAYMEWNFAPNGDWAAYTFKGYRERTLSASSFTPAKIRWERGGNACTVEATIPVYETAHLGPTTAGNPALRIGLTAVLEHAGGQRTYWALRHPAAKPDFHQPEGFILGLP